MMFPTLPSVAIIVLVLNGVLCGYDDTPVEVEPWNSVRSYKPLDFMVDITNKLGLNILFEHNFLNDNNIAFSPYGLTGILVALYEGVDGYSALQIRESMQLPGDRRIVRIGFRDIHRRLRSYFIPEEGFLAGLTFNNENVTFRKDYRDILQFYGYDFEIPKPLPTQSEATTVPHMSEAFSVTTSTRRTEDVEILTTTAREHIETNSVIPATTESATPFVSTNSTTTESASTIMFATPTTELSSNVESAKSTTESSTLTQVNPKTDSTTTFEMANASTQPASTKSTSDSDSVNPTTEPVSGSTLASPTVPSTSATTSASSTIETTSTLASPNSKTESTSTLGYTDPTTKSPSTPASTNPTTEFFSTLADTNPTTESTLMLASNNSTTESSSTLLFGNPTADSSSTSAFVDLTTESTPSIVNSTTESASTESFANSTTESPSLTNATTQSTTTNAVETTLQSESSTLLISNPSSQSITTLSGESENEIFILESTTDDAPTTESKFTQNPEVQSTNTETISNTRVSRSTEDVTSKSMMLDDEETLTTQSETSTMSNIPTTQNNFEEMSVATTAMDVGTATSNGNSNNTTTSGPPTEETISTTNSIVSTQMTTAELMNNTEVITFPTSLQTTVRTTTDNPSTILITVADAATASDVPTTESQIGEIVSTIEDTDITITEKTSTVSEVTEATSAEKQKSSIRKERSLRKLQVFQPILHDQFAFYRPLFLRNPNYARSGLQYQRSFLANGYSKVQITYMTYDTILEFAYIPYLKSMAVKLPLDTPDYYLMIILPDYEFGVNQLINDLRSEEAPSLRDVNYMLSDTHVRAWVPSFMLKGLIVLTTDLQKLGICDVFEPRQDDFKPMTEQRNIYVRNIEQAITVTIRKYMEPNLVKRYAYNRPPVEFAATHPFVYFVMDSSLHVALMAGKIVNPLNSRIL